jgi:tetratricopeptide (TPR) repeat protein
VTRGFFWLALLLSGATARAQDKPPAPPTVPPAVKEQEPPEEDPDLIPKEYSFNPLEASRNILAGNFYFKKGNYRAASKRYLEASKWDPTSSEALLRLAEADEKLRDFAGARDAYTKYLAMPDIKDAEVVKKKLAKLPQSRSKK